MPADPRQLADAAARAMRAGDAARAWTLACSHERTGSVDPGVLEIRAVAALRLGRLHDADAAAGRAIEAASSTAAQARLLAHRARARLRLARHKDALRDLDDALARAPDQPGLLGAKADALLHLGRDDDARALVEHAFARGLAHPSLSIAYARVAETAGAAVERLEAHVDDPALAVDLRASVLFQLGRLHDRAGDADRAMEAFRRANNLVRTPHDPAELSGVVDEIIERWRPASIRAVKRTPRAGELPVLVVGVPRSGTSLVEQIIDRHPRAQGLGELPDLPQVCVGRLRARARAYMAWIDKPGGLRARELAQAGGAYLDALAGGTAPGVERAIDKQLMNLFLLGPAALMFTDLRIVWVRRDPRDVCLSCYMQLFAASHAWSHELAHIASFHRDADRLMGHWADVLPDATGARVHQLRYEALVADAEGETRRLADFLGLDWTPAMLSFHESTRIVDTASTAQVRRPLSGDAVARWTRYRQHLHALDAVFGPVG